ncbi:membrane dipeptidase [Alteromonas sp. 345S023]|uniref:Membrane dipeptidase n=1 Tax=Alteromonas profundi TaxID=2696062 RepID=A0A7X5RKZ9_9ALTE|nr:dipeptidase [Alteromonas profundi]NDV91518.1 membrane dipeptidase [Alteromonas profundi]
MIKQLTRSLCALTVAASLSPCWAATDPSKIHDSLVVMDTHLDTPALLVQPGFDIMHAHTYSDDFSQVDVPRMDEGGLDGGFWVIYTPQGPVDEEGFEAARDTALLRAMAIHKMVASHPDTFALAKEPEDAKNIAAQGKKIVYISMENAYPLGEDLSLLDTFYKMGLRMIGPVHFKNNQFGDSSTDPEGPKYDGLSPLGEKLVKRANELGIVLDGSHAHDALVEDMIALSKTPIILSHSGTKAIYDHPRNVDDSLLKKLVESGGVIHVNAYGSYLTELPSDPERSKAYGVLFKQMGDIANMTAEEVAALKAKRKQIDLEHPAVRATFEDYMEHFLHILEVAGPKHTGVGADWDGGGGVERMMDVAALPLITERLLAEGYSKDDLADIWGNNALRLLQQAQDYADSLDQ